MENKYIIRKKSLNEVLDNISNFEDKMKIFLAKHKNFQYNILIDRDELTNEWLVEINMKNTNEQSNMQESKEVIRSRKTL